MARVRLALSYALGFAVSLALALVVPLAIATQLGRAHPAPRPGVVTPANRPPSVFAGPNVRVVLGQAVFLWGKVTDDGLPDRHRPIAAVWSQVRGPQAAGFADPAAPRTSVTFPLPGLYALRLTADDGALSGIDDLMVEVTAPGRATRAPAVWRGDVGASGRVRVREDSLQLVGEDGDRMVGLRFTRLGIPRNAKILSARVRFEAGEEDAWAGPLSIRGRDVDDAPGFTGASRGADLRPFTVAGVDWLPVAGTGTAAAGGGRLTPDLSAVVQEIVCRPGWVPGNALVLVLAGTGSSPVEPVAGGGEPILQVEYREPPGARSRS